MSGGLLEDLNFDRADEDSMELVGKIQLKKYGQFLNDFAQTFQTVKQSLIERVPQQNLGLPLRILESVQYENVTLFELISSENRLFRKVMLSLTALCNEIELLTSEANVLLNAFILFGESKTTHEEALKSGEAQQQVGRMLDAFQQLSSFVTRAGDVIKAAVQQLSAIHGGLRTPPQNVTFIDSNDLHLITIFEHLLDLLGVLISFDCVLSSHGVLEDQWQSYRRTLASAMQNPGKVGVEVDRLRPFDRYLMRLKGQLLDGVILQVCIEQEYENAEVFVNKNQKFAKELKFIIQRLAELLMERIGEPGETDHRNKFIGLCGLILLDFHLFRSVDKKTMKFVWSVHKKLPVIYIGGMHSFVPTRFLMVKIPSLNKVLSNSELQSGSVETAITAWLSNKEANLEKTVGYCESQTVNWLVQAAREFDTYSMEKQRPGGVEAQLNQRTELLISGFLHASSMSHFVRTWLTAFVGANRRAGKALVLQLCRLIEYVKAIERTYTEKTLQIARVLPYIVEFLSYQLVVTLRTVRREFGGAKGPVDLKKADGIAALQMAEDMAAGPLTLQRLMIIKISLNFAFKFNCFSDEQLKSVYALVQKLSTIVPLFSGVRSAANLNLLYWHRHALLTAFLRHAYETGEDIRRLPFLMDALQDGFVPIAACRHLESPRQLADFYFEDVFDIINGELLSHLCTDIENDLRIATHTHLKLDDRNPLKTPMKDLKQFIRLPPIVFHGKVINVKAHVERYLDRIFYNLTTVALHDWMTYGRMRLLAKHRYGLDLVDSHLPSQTLEQGMDALVIMREIDAFTESYFYNLNNQIFIEKRSKNSFYNVVNIRHVSNSIRTHGTGIMNTMVNYCYQFLRNRLNAFALFLADENIKSRLMKDIRYFKENHWNKDQRYPFDRADKFNKGIRKLGVENGLSFLDKFRMLITHIGNALGFVRMIRSGGMHCISEAVCFIPDPGDLPNFRALAEQDDFTGTVLESAANLTDLLDSQTKSFSSCVDYFKLLINVFSNEMRDPKRLHLKNFYVIVPPLTVNFVEYLMASKERINRKNVEGSAFTDDGFAMGVAYLLTTLDQWDDFDSLHWFQSVRNKHLTEQKSAQTQLQSNAGATDDKLRQTLQLTLTRLASYQREFDLVSFSLTSARIFFRSDSAPEQQPKQPQQSATPVAEGSASTGAAASSN